METQQSDLYGEIQPPAQMPPVVKKPTMSAILAARIEEQNRRIDALESRILAAIQAQRPPTPPQNIPQSTGTDAAALLMAFSQMQANNTQNTLNMLRAVKELMPEIQEANDDGEGEFIGSLIKGFAQGQQQPAATFPAPTPAPPTPTPEPDKSGIEPPKE